MNADKWTNRAAEVARIRAAREASSEARRLADLKSPPTARKKPAKRRRKGPFA